MMLKALPSQIQGILGASKKQPHLATLVDRDQPNVIHFMFGTECLLSYQRDDLSTRNALVGMLCSAGVRLADVARVFALDPRQAARYARRFQSDGLRGLMEAERGRPVKVTSEIEAFVRAEFRVLFRQKRRGFRDALRDRVEAEFGLRLGYERIRQITKPVRDEIERAEAQASLPEQAGTPPAQGVAAQSTERPVVDDLGGEEGDGDEPAEASEESLRQGFYTRYAGGLLLNVFIHKLLRGTAQVVARKSRGVFQSFALMVVHMVQFGCVNLERTKTLLRREFGVVVGLHESPTLKTMRRWLARLSGIVDSGRVQAVLAKNYLKHLVREKHTFYMDGHFGPYTGGAGLVLGYYPQRRWMVPGYTHYVVCDARGVPVFFELDDETDDFRQAIPRLVRQTHQLVGSQEKLKFVFDRGGYSRELFASFDEELNAYYIAWEKHDDTDYRRYDIEWYELTVEFQGNHEQKPKVKRLWVGDCPDEVAVSAWGPSSPIRHHRKLLMRSALKDGNGDVKGYRIAPFLTNHPRASHEELGVELLYRWREENEFEVLGHEFGFDEITSYLMYPYADLEEHDPEAFARLSEREIDNPRRKKLDALRGKLAKRVATLEQRLARLGREGRSSGHRRVREAQEELSKVRAELAECEARREAEPKQINHLQYLIEEGKDRPDFGRKLLVDLLRVCARNCRRQTEDLIRKHYLNRRDHVTLLRRMLHAGGSVKLDRQGVVQVRLDGLNTDAENEVFTQMLADINALKPKTFGTVSRPMRFELNSET